MVYFVHRGVPIRDREPFMYPRRTWAAVAVVLLVAALLLWLFADDLDAEGLVSFPWHAL